ncbi:hypothetical protein SmJEL517_g00272 [Synchytrium microbalum]|uniref:Uncharacterized protein n=1 Tax=Synchytrium microbalum TaxID=1806994 RepID=A0A507CIJ8_9FUNG|nr:uncharacterized protein SmJEL517_g00272 [Synchytrium microbalum]TPX37964.1 hypothetical protein SmJEL517_g00272 [Synchytrium microbalum]
MTGSEALPFSFEDAISKADETRHPSLQQFVGDCLFHGHQDLKVKINKELAFSYYKEGARQKHMPSLKSLANCYWTGEGARYNPHKAIKLLTHVVAATNELDSIKRLAAWHWQFGEMPSSSKAPKKIDDETDEGESDRDDDDTSEEEEDDDDPDPDDDTITSRNPGHATCLKLLLRASAMGDISSTHQAASIFLNGYERIIPANPKKAEELLEYAVSLGDSDATIKLANFHYEQVLIASSSIFVSPQKPNTTPQQPTRRNPLNGASPKTPTSQQQHSQAQSQLMAMALRPMPSALCILADRAKEHLERAAALGDAGSLIALGDLYRDGRITSEEGLDCKLKALELYSLASEKYDVKGMFSAAHMLVTGDGVPVDLRRAFQFLLRASKISSTPRLRDLADFLSAHPLPTIESSRGASSSDMIDDNDEPHDPTPYLLYISSYETEHDETCLIPIVSCLLTGSLGAPLNIPLAIHYLDQAMDSADADLKVMASAVLEAARAEGLIRDLRLAKMDEGDDGEEDVQMESDGEELQEDEEDGGEPMQQGDEEKGIGEDDGDGENDGGGEEMQEEEEHGVEPMRQADQEKGAGEPDGEDGGDKPMMANG